MGADDSLPDDVTTLQAMLRAERAARLAAEAETQANTLLIEKLKLMIRKLRHEQFGQSSERSAFLDQLELQLEEMEGTAPPADAAWAVYFLSGRKPRQAVPSRRLRLWARELAGVPEWLFDESYHHVGDVVCASHAAQRDGGVALPGHAVNHVAVEQVEDGNDSHCSQGMGYALSRSKGDFRREHDAGPPSRLRHDVSSGRAVDGDRRDNRLSLPAR